jgi:putative ABC transport system permease protein
VQVNGWIDTLAQDLRYAIRRLRANPSFTIIAVLSLGIGISANTTIFSAMNAVLLRPLPYTDQDLLVAIYNNPVNEPGFLAEMSAADIEHLRIENQVFERLELSAHPEMAAMSGPGNPERISVQQITPGTFPMLGVSTVLGTIPSEQDLRKLSLNPIFLGYEFWKRHFQGDPKVLGKTFFVENESAMVLAVLSPGFDLFGRGPTDVFEPITVASDGPADKDRWLTGFGKLKPGITIAQAQASVDIVSQRLANAYPETNKGMRIQIKPLQEGLFGSSRPLLILLLTAAAFVLLIACANIASLLLSRASGRRKEIGIRIALGANRWRLIRQMLTESELLSLLGGIFGLFLSVWGVKFFIAITPLWFPQLKTINLDGRVLAFTFVVSIFAGIVFGLAPALTATKSGVNASLKESGHSSASVARHRTRSILVVLEVALALVLLVSAGLLLNTLVRVLHTDPGFDPNSLLTAEVRLTGAKYFDVSQWNKTGLDVVTPQVALFSRRILERLKALPGIDSVAVIDWLPMAENSEHSYRGFTIAGHAASFKGDTPQALFNAVSPDYFRVMRIPLRTGRGLTDQDTESAPWVVLINEAMAHKFWPTQNPIGQLITLDTVPDERPRQIVGIVGNVRQFQLATQSVPEMYAPFPQQSALCPGGLDETRLHKSVVIRANVVSKSLIESVRKSMVEVAIDSPVFGITTVKQTVSNSAKGKSFLTQVLGSFAIVALLLASIGIYGVISYSVGERTREIGLRMALGAQSRQVLTLLLQEGIKLSLIGVTIGLAAFFAATPTLSTILYDVKAHDPYTLSFVCLILIGVSIVATYIPARRAMRVDPMVALRHE